MQWQTKRVGRALSAEIKAALLQGVKQDNLSHPMELALSSLQTAGSLSVSFSLFWEFGYIWGPFNFIKAPLLSF